MIFTSSFLQEAKQRGYINQCSDIDALDKKMAAESITAYAGFDPTARSLQVGNLLQIMMMRLLQKHGHRPLILMGGATSLIGDPSGKTELRKMLTHTQISDHIDSIRHIFMRVLNFNTGEKPELLNNADWLTPLAFIGFLRDFGPLFSINRMLTFESVKSRLETQNSLSLLEFNYMVLQAYDYLHLNKTFDCCLQTGGSDQWGNIVSGIDLVRRVQGKQVFALTTELVVTANGQKMGKTADGAVWLNADMTSPYDFWQFWRNTHDNDVIKYLKLFTDLPISRIEELSQLNGQDINQAKIILADTITDMLHGPKNLEEVKKQIATFFKGEADDNFAVFELTKDELKENLDKILLNLNLVKSLGEARRLAAGHGVRVNDEIIDDAKSYLHIGADKRIKISIGKKKHYVVRVL